MNSDWGTPPNGDFARYVDQLTARSVRQLQAASRAEASIDDAPGAVPPAHAGRMRPVAGLAPGAAPATEAGGNDQAMRGFARSLAIGWAGLLLVLMTMGSTGTAFGVLVIGLWGGFQLRRWLLPPGGAAALKSALDDLARQQAAQNSQGKK